MLIKNIIKETVFDYLNEENQRFHYRAVPKFIGKSVNFKPEGFYEATDDDGNPIMFTGDVWARSDTPELAASKTVGGAILGLWSMGNHHNLGLKNAFIYQINEKPQKDLSHIRTDDFEWIKEVRYLKSVKGTYLGKFMYDQQFNDNATNFYNRFSDDPWEIEELVDLEKWEDFERFLLTINVSDLK